MAHLGSSPDCAEGTAAISTFVAKSPKRGSFAGVLVCDTGWIKSKDCITGRCWTWVRSMEDVS